MFGQAEITWATDPHGSGRTERPSILPTGNQVFPTVVDTNRCIAIDKLAGWWTNEDCHQIKKRFICKFAQETSSSQTTVTMSSPTTTPQKCLQCKPGYGYFRGFCYQVVQNYVTWSAAETECVREGGHLASVHSLEENIYIQQSVLALPTITVDDCDHGRWLMLGLWNPANDNNWVWTDGTNTSYIQWMTGSPSDYCGGGVRCNIMGYTSTGGSWGSRSVSLHNAFYVCKLPAS